MTAGYGTLEEGSIRCPVAVASAVGPEVETRSDVMRGALVCTGCSHSLALVSPMKVGWIVLGSGGRRRWWVGSVITAILVLTVIGMLSTTGVIGMTIIG
jgi:hypothetical protein